MLKRFLLAALLSLMAGHAPAASPILGNPVNTVQSTATEGSHILLAVPGNLLGFSATSGTTAGYILLIDSATVPADGAVTPKYCYALPASQTIGASWFNFPAPFANGIVIVFSTTGCFSKNISTTSFFNAQVQQVGP